MRNVKATNPEKEFPITANAAQKEAAEMFWECLRRRNDYRENYIAYIRLFGKYIRAMRKHTNEYYAPQYLSARIKMDKKADEIRKKYPMGCITDPDKPFSVLNNREKWGICETRRSFSGITLQAAEIDEELYGALVRTCFCLRRSIGLPSDMIVKILPSRKTIAAASNKKILPRWRADIKQFRNEMRAWDMRKVGKSWCDIGCELRIKIAYSTKDKLVTAARNYYKAADDKIRNLADWRVVN